MLSSTMRCHSDNGASAAGPRSITPALLTSVSRRPRFETVCSTASAASSSLVTSHSMTSAVPPASPISLASVSSLSLRRAARATAAPVAESWRAVAAPIPLDAPVTSATVPSRAEAMTGVYRGEFAASAV